MAAVRFGFSRNPTHRSFCCYKPLVHAALLATYRHGSVSSNTDRDSWCQLRQWPCRGFPQWSRQCRVPSPASDVFVLATFVSRALLWLQLAGKLRVSAKFKLLLAQATAHTWRRWAQPSTHCLRIREVRSYAHNRAPNRARHRAFGGRSGLGLVSSPPKTARTNLRDGSSNQGMPCSHWCFAPRQSAQAGRGMAFHSLGLATFGHCDQRRPVPCIAKSRACNRLRQQHDPASSKLAPEDCSRDHQRGGLALGGCWPC